MSSLSLLGIAYDGGASHRRGAAAAPDRIREALRSSATNGWSETGLRVDDHLHDAGNVSVPADENPRPVIEAALTKDLEQGCRPLVLGGDHSVTHPVLRALRPRQPQLTVLQIDAHPDLYDAFEGDRYSHACPFARVLEEGLVDRLVQVGIRAMNGHQREQAERFGVEVHPARDGPGDSALVQGPVYVSVDLDAIDPSAAPGVSHREPGGLSVRAVLDCIHALEGPVVGGDVVEYNPERDLDGMTAEVAAKLARELAGQILKTAPDAGASGAG